VQVFLSFVYKCIVVDDPDIKRGFGIPLNGLIPPYLCAYPKSGHRFPMSYIVFFVVFSELMCVVTARFVDIGGIVYHFCLTLIFIILLVICMSYTIMIFNIIERFVYGV
jgi:hypothetical protein